MVAVMEEAEQLTLFDDFPEIGSEEYANQAKTQRTYLTDEGWEYLDSGSYRDVFLGPDGVVYKRDPYNGEYKHGSNAMEAETLETLQERGFTWVPEFHLFANGILAMQYLVDAPIDEYEDIEFSELSPENRERAEEIESYIFDSHGKNVGISPKDGLLYVRDAGNGSSA